MLGEFCAEAAAGALLEQLAARLPGTDAADGEALQRVMTKAFKAAHEAALALYRAPPEHPLQPLLSRLNRSRK